MTLQTVIVALLVAGSFAYAAWTLLPQVMRRALASGLLRLPLPGRWRARLQTVARATAGGCGCSGCDALPPPAAKPQPVVFHPRSKR